MQHKLCSSVRVLKLDSQGLAGRGCLQTSWSYQNKSQKMSMFFYEGMEMFVSLL